MLLFLLSLTPATAHERRINTWLINGPHRNIGDSGFDTDYLDGETTVTPAVGDSAGSTSWLVMDDRLYCRNQDDYVDLSTFFLPSREGAPSGGNEWVVAYAHVYIWSPEAQPYRLLFGASDGAKVWINGHLIATYPIADRQPLRDESALEIMLQSGWNRLLIKSANRWRIWGFYAIIADTDGDPVNDLEYSVDEPSGPLAITTAAMPYGYTSWPYVWLTIDGVTPNHSVPSASPFRFIATGGLPPYSWEIVDGSLPPGLSLDRGEGELLGFSSDHTGRYPFTMRVTDTNGSLAETTLVLDVVDRPTKWLEEEKIGGLIHGTPDDSQHVHGPPEEQARVMARQGYAFAAQTSGWTGLIADGSFSYLRHQEYMDAFRGAGIRFGSYLNLYDNKVMNFPTEDFSTWARYLDFHHRYFEEWLSETHAAVLWLDGAQVTAPIPGMDYTDLQNKGWDFDPLFSMAKTVSPVTLIIANCGGNARLDWRLGDCDVFSTEGMNDQYNPYWERFPEGRSGHNPKPIPNESWRYPFKSDTWGEYADWKEWTRVVVSIVCEGNICNLDHSYQKDNGTYQLHIDMGAWLEKRWESLKHTKPGPLTDQPWGYCVSRDSLIYLHILTNQRGKAGLNGQTRLELPSFALPVENITLVPSGEIIPYTMSDDRLVLNFSGISPDEVDTIVKISGGLSK